MKITLKHIYYIVAILALMIVSVFLLKEVSSISPVNKAENVMSKGNYRALLQSYFDSSESAKKIVSTFDMSIIKSDIEMATHSVDVLMSSVIKSVNVHNALLPAFKNELATVGVDEAGKVNVLKSGSESFKGFIRDIEDNYLRITKFENDYFIAPDTERILKEYGQYVSPPLKGVLEYMTKEDYPLLFSNDSIRFDLDYIYERITSAEELIGTFEDSIFVVNIGYRMVYYYELLFGVNHNEFVDASMDYKIDYINKITSISEQNVSNTSVKGRILGFLKTISAENYKRTPNVDIFTQEMLTEVSVYVEAIRQKAMADAQ